MRRSNGYLRWGLVLVTLLGALILLGYFWTPYDPQAMSGSEKFLPPSPAHPMGTDNFGRDVLSRVLKGAGSTVWVALGTVAIGAGVGTLVGAVTGYFGGWVDALLMRFNDAFTAFPSILVALVAVAVLGQGRSHVILALGIVFIPSYARIVRGEFARCRAMPYAVNARLMGASHGRILFAHLLPNVMPVLLSTLAIGFNNAVLAEASLSFLGIGVEPTKASLGYMLSEAQSYLVKAPWYALSVGLSIVLLILSFSLLSEGLQRRES